MITSIPGAATRAVRTSNSGTDREPVPVTPRMPEEARATRPAGGLGQALKTLVNVTIDCVRGRYDR